MSKKKGYSSLRQHILFDWREVALTSSTIEAYTSAVAKINHEQRRRHSSGFMLFFVVSVVIICIFGSGGLFAAAFLWVIPFWICLPFASFQYYVPNSLSVAQELLVLRKNFEWQDELYTFVKNKLWYFRWQILKPILAEILICYAATFILYMILTDYNAQHFRLFMKILGGIMLYYFSVKSFSSSLYGFSESIMAKQPPIREYSVLENEAALLAQQEVIAESKKLKEYKQNKKNKASKKHRRH